MDFVKQFQREDASARAWSRRGVTIYKDRTFTFITKTPPAAVLLNEGSGHREGSATSNGKRSARSPRPAQEDRRNQMQDLNATDLRGRDQHDRGDGAVDGLVVEGLMRTHGKKYRLRWVRSSRAAVRGAGGGRAGEEHGVREVRRVGGRRRPLGVDPKHADQIVRARSRCRTARGRKSRAGHRAGEKVKEAEAAGADFVGIEYVAKIKEGLAGHRRHRGYARRDGGSWARSERSGRAG